MAECKMEMIETAEFKILWQCSSCSRQHKDTRKFEKAKSCPSCGAVIVGWNSLYEEEIEE